MVSRRCNTDENVNHFLRGRLHFRPRCILLWRRRNHVARSATQIPTEQRIRWLFNSSVNPILIKSVANRVYRWFDALRGSLRSASRRPRMQLVDVVVVVVVVGLRSWQCYRTRITIYAGYRYVYVIARLQPTTLLIDDE